MQLTYFSLSCAARYIEVPKCASTSIKLALLESDGVREKFGQYPHACPRWRSVPGYFQPCVSFTFVRHPLARLVSAWREKLQTGKAKQLGGACQLPRTASFDDWVEWVTSQHPSHVDKHWRPQVRILKRDGWPDFVGKVENLAADWQRLRELTGLPALPHANPSPPSAQAHLSVWTRRKFDTFYAEDFLAFDYID